MKLNFFLIFLILYFSQQQTLRQLKGKSSFYPESDYIYIDIKKKDSGNNLNIEFEIRI